jgi:hypothetical protein
VTFVSQQLRAGSLDGSDYALPVDETSGASSLPHAFLITKEDVSCINKLGKLQHLALLLHEICANIAVDRELFLRSERVSE